jgi:hypothetical protein
LLPLGEVAARAVRGRRSISAREEFIVASSSDSRSSIGKRAMQQPSYWFPAKRHGWGWGPPSSWQGWAVLVAFFALLAASAFVFLPAQRIAAFLACTVVLTLLLVGVCAAKGERPSWRSSK